MLVLKDRDMGARPFEIHLKEKQYAERQEALAMLNYFNKVSCGRAKAPSELRCTICDPSKMFTAQASLVCHYRSHAGIKPFVCCTCGASFTRQHSLKYHIMVHSNTLKHRCEHCGREFRHGSHFKEHLRKHTGETPFECSDCHLGFKTRNTYKRHLYHRHGKILTADGGVTIMAPEEAQKVRTKPRKSKGVVFRKPDHPRFEEQAYPACLRAVSGSFSKDTGVQVAATDFIEHENEVAFGKDLLKISRQGIAMQLRPQPEVIEEFRCITVTQLPLVCVKTTS